MILKLSTYIIIYMIQVLLCNNMKLYGIYVPYIYIYIITYITIDHNFLKLYMIAFLLGCIIDIFDNTMGLHCMACICMTFYKVLIYNFYKKKKWIEQINYNKTDIFNYINTYLSIVIHHFILYHFALFSLKHFGIITLHVLKHSIMTSFFIFFIKFLNK